MKSVLLRLEGPLQAWGTESHFPHRDTQREPSKSGVLGLIGAALGMRRDDVDQLTSLATATMAVRVDREGEILSDYHTAGGGTFRGQPHGVHGTDNPVITHRAYLTSASFLVALGFADEALAARVDAAVGSPRWPLVLGRRACSPSLPVQAGMVETDPEAALRSAVYPAPIAPVGPLRVVVECAPDAEGAQPRQDQPVSFALHHRSYARRWVRTVWLEPAALTLLSPTSEPVSLVHLLSRTS